jgi:hypothetical protein
MLYMETPTKPITTRYTVTVRWLSPDGTERTGTNTLTTQEQADRLEAAAVAEYGRGNVIASSYTF